MRFSKNQNHKCSKDKSIRQLSCCLLRLSEFRMPRPPLNIAVLVLISLQSRTIEACCSENPANSSSNAKNSTSAIDLPQLDRFYQLWTAVRILEALGTKVKQGHDEWPLVSS